MLWQKGKYEELEFNMSVHIKVNLRKENKQSQVHRQPEQTLVGDDLQRATYDKGTREQRLQASWEIVSDLLYFGHENALKYLDPYKAQAIEIQSTMDKVLHYSSLPEDAKS